MSNWQPCAQPSAEACATYPSSPQLSFNWLHPNVHVQAMLEMADTGALLRFVQRPNAAALDEGGRALASAGRYAELVALYQRRECHAAALDLLHALSQARVAFYNSHLSCSGMQHLMWKRRVAGPVCMLYAVMQT